MAITIIEYNRRLQGVINDLQTGAHAQVMMTIANGAISLIRKRVQETGEMPSGGSYPEYSLGYKKIREKKGRQTAFVDFTFTGRMWNNIKLVSDQNELEGGIAVIKATEDLQKQKLAGNTERKGEILALSEQEKEKVTKYYEQGILNIFRKNQLL